MITTHKFFFHNSNNMKELKDNSVNLIVTSPPYPMIEMWDDIMGKQNIAISKIQIKQKPNEVFELMHQELDKVWKECFRVLAEGGFLCINVGDATRTVNGNFKLYDNHSRIAQYCNRIGFNEMPCVLWRKETNAPNKFMGSGMLPCGAYITLEHEYILIFRKGNKRNFKTSEDKMKRMESAFFWEERNIWFSDIWNIKGCRQSMKKTASRNRSGAYPFEIPYRLISMFSEKEDTVLDPFSGTGTTASAAVLLCRNSVGYEINKGFIDIINQNINPVSDYNRLIEKRIKNHSDFIKEKSKSKQIKYFNKILNVPVITRQEVNIKFNTLKKIEYNNEKYKIFY